MDKKKRNTIILCAVIVAVSVFAMILQETVFQKEGRYAVIQVDGEEVMRLDLAEDVTVEIGDAQNGYNRVEVKDGYVSVTEADCPDKVCVDTGRIKDTGGVIACLPHELIITVVGSEEEEKIDGMTW